MPKTLPKSPLLAAALAALVAGLPAVAQAEYPEKPIEMIVAFAPGGGTDVAARSIAHYVEKYLGEGAKVAVVNKPGAGGEIGWTALARAEADGYTIGMINPPAINALAVEGKAKYQMTDFQPIANLVYDPAILVVAKDSPYKTLAELTDAAKKTPGAVVVGTSGAAGSSEHIAILNLNRLSGATFTPAFFGSTAPVRQAILGGHVPAATMNLSEALELARAGSVRVLGVMSDARQDSLPEAPTFREQGVDLVVTASRGLATPKGVSPEIVAKLQKAVDAAMHDPEYLAAATKAEIPLHFLGPDDYQALIDRITADLSETWKVTPWR